MGFGVAWGDYDNDGDLDLAVSNLTGTNKIYVNHGTDFIPPGVIPVGRDRESYGLAWGDYDSDGDLDLAVANRGQNELCQNTENDSDYMKVTLKGLGLSGFSNRDGIGAKVRVYDAGTSNLRGFREISAGCGFCTMNSLDAEFGVPQGDTFDIEMTWPVSGRVCLIESVVPPAVLSVTEDCIVTGVAESLKGHPSQDQTFKLRQNRPNPFSSHTIISYEVGGRPPADAGWVSLDIYDLAGRLVASFVEDRRQTGLSEIRWNGEDTAGNRAPSGVYFYRLKLGELQETRQMHLVR